MSTKFQKLEELEKSRKITLGVDRSHANNFWSKQNIIGKVLNWLTPLFIIFSIFAFIKFGFIKGTMLLIGTGVYVFVIQKIATMNARIILLGNEELFNAAYEAKSVTVRNNSTGKILSFPADWRSEIANL